MRSADILLPSLSPQHPKHDHVISAENPTTRGTCMQAGLLSILYTVTLPRTLNLTCNLGHVTSNILTAHSAPELYLRQANQLESSEKNGNLTSAVFSNRALLRFNTLKPQLDSKKTW